MDVPLTVISAVLISAFIDLIGNAPASGQASEPIPAITVEAQREREKLRHDVDAFAASAMTKSYDDSFMRWDHPVCPLVAGLTRQEGEFVLLRLSNIARSAHVPLGKENCKPNFFVMIARNPSTFLKILWRRRPTLFDTSHGVAPVKRFIEYPRPVRVWYNAASIDDTGGRAYTSALAESAGFGMGTVDYPVHILPSSLGSRITTPVVRNIDSALIVVDPEKIQALNIGQIVDYVALVGLAQINLDRDLGQAPSILKVFSDSAVSPPLEMTAWDKALLLSLYSTEQKNRMQLSQMETVMIKEISAHGSEAGGSSLH
jgi:hypothetical protein